MHRIFLWISRSCLQQQLRTFSAQVLQETCIAQLEHKVEWRFHGDAGDQLYDVFVTVKRLKSDVNKSLAPSNFDHRIRFAQKCRVEIRWCVLCKSHFSFTPSFALYFAQSLLQPFCSPLLRSLNADNPCKRCHKRLFLEASARLESFASDPPRRHCGNRCRNCVEKCRKTFVFERTLMIYVCAFFSQRNTFYVVVRRRMRSKRTRGECRQ